MRRFAVFTALALGLAPIGCNLLFGQSDLEVVDPGEASSTGPGGDGGGGGSAAPGTSVGSTSTSTSTGTGGGSGCEASSCSGRGTCDDASGSPTCTCDDRFTGPTCATCAEGYEGATCASCSPGFEDVNDDGTCLPTCTAGGCANGGVCDPSGTCRCRPDFTGQVCGDPCPTGTAGAGCEFRIVYGVDIPAAILDWSAPDDVPYDVDQASRVGAFDRVAYRLILDDEEVWVEMDAFTANASRLGVPVDWVWDQPLQGILVRSFSANQDQVTTETLGNIEAWSACYTEGANDVYDHDDVISSDDCYGSLQIHVEERTVLAFNNWSDAGEAADVGLGPSPGQHPDWTFSSNAASFDVRRLEVYVRQ